MFTRKLLAGVAALALTAACTESAEEETAAAPAAAPAPAVSEAAADCAIAPAEAEQTERERLYAWFDAEFQRELAYSPIFQTILGQIDDLEAYGSWDDVSEEAFRAGLAREQARIACMQANFDFDALDQQGQVSWRFAEFIAEDNARQAQFWDRGYVFTQFISPHASLPSILIGSHRVDNVEHAEAYVSRLSGLGALVDDLVSQADARAQEGVLPPAFAYPIIIQSAESFITGAPFDDSENESALLSDLRTKVNALEISDEEKTRLIDAGIEALRTSVQPAYQNLADTMARHAEMAGDANNGVWAIPDGEAYYASQLENYTTGLGMTAEEIHQTGLDEVERIHGEMRAIMEQVGFEGTLQDFFEYMRTDPQFYYPNTEEGRQRYLDEATAMIDTMNAAAGEYFGALPTGALEVRAVEQFRITTATGAFYEPGSLDGSRPGRYYVNLANMEELPVYQMETLAYHEGAPGHHFQVALAQELDSVPMFQRQAWYSAYGEGWALYAEALGKDMGFFTDPYQDFGRLSYEVFRAARLVVDTGVHHYRWSEEDANAYMLENTPMTAGDIQNEVRRYIVWPGQAVSYKVGMLHIMDLRTRAQEALGEDFDWGEFHDVVLTNGSVPLSIMEELVMAYIEEKQAGG
jgi:uncharacterized protein (DUF885 family)